MHLCLERAYIGGIYPKDLKVQDTTVTGIFKNTDHPVDVEPIENYTSNAISTEIPSIHRTPSTTNAPIDNFLFIATRDGFK